MKKLAISKINVLDIMKACIISIIISLLCVLILALCVKIFTIDTNVIMPINQVIKILSIFGGCFFGFKCVEKGAIKGGIVGIFYAILSMLVFGLIENTVSFKSFNWYDFTACIIAGLISGILVVNIKKSK